MEGYHQRGTGIINPFHFHDTFPYASDDLGPIDFMDEANFDQFVDLIRGDESFNNVQIDAAVVGHHEQNNNIARFSDGVPRVESSFDFSIAKAQAAADEEGDFSLIQTDECRLTREEITDGVIGGDMNNVSKTKKSCNKGDRSKTLVSERKRRGRMKEKLYALRALVPNITKMDKASIVGDAVSYVQALQAQEKNLKAEIASLESSSSSSSRGVGDRAPQCSNKTNLKTMYPITKKIFQMDVFQIHERGFYIRIIANKGHGVAASLYKGIEALTSMVVQSSNLTTTIAENYVLTCTLQMKEREMENAIIRSQDLELWIARVFINQGFEFEISHQSMMSY